MRRRVHRRGIGLILMACGLLLVFGAFTLTEYNIYTDYKAGQEIVKVIEKLESKKAAQQKYDTISPLMEMPTIEVNGYLFVGTLTVPKLGLELPVMDSWSYEKLRRAPCRYKGSVYQNNMIIAAHNYRSHFGKLKTLEAGDKVKFADVDGNEFNYVVVEKKLLEPTAIEEMESGEWDLTLFTCTVGGAARVTIRCNAVDTD